MKLVERAPQKLPLLVAEDGRGIEPSLGAMRGEAARQERHGGESADLLAKAELGADSLAAPGTYYGLPLLQPVVWEAAIPIYFYVGGAAGACATLAAVAQLRGGLPNLVKRGRWIGLAGAVVSGGLLIEDLGRPGRFLNMLRVFRPTSPMSVGSWVLTGFGAAVSGAAVLGGRKGALGKLGEACGMAAGVLGLPLIGYTGVLLAATAVPAWQLAKSSLPPLFVASAAASAASLHELLPLALSARESKVVSRIGTVAKVAELCATLAIERDLAKTPRVVRALRHGLAGVLWNGARACVAAGLALSLAPGKPRWKRRATGLLGTVGAIATRLAIFHAGRRSALDARGSFAAQRQAMLTAPR